MQQAPRDLVRTTLGVLAIGGLIIAVFWILRPFLAATIWATMIVVATWPLMLWFEARLWRRRSLAVAVMTLLLLLLFVARFTGQDHRQELDPGGEIRLVRSCREFRTASRSSHRSPPVHQQWGVTGFSPTMVTAKSPAPVRLPLTVMSRPARSD